MSNYAVFLKRVHSDNQEVVGVLGGFESEGEAKHWANSNGWGRVARDPKRGGAWVVEVQALGVDELRANRKAYLKFEAERNAEAERIAREQYEENARKMREQRLAELVEEQERKAFLAERARWRKAAEKELAKEDSIPESTRATVDTLRGTTGND